MAQKRNTKSVSFSCDGCGKKTKTKPIIWENPKTQSHSRYCHACDDLLIQDQPLPKDIPKPKPTNSYLLWQLVQECAEVLDAGPTELKAECGDLVAVIQMCREANIVGTTSETLTMPLNMACAKVIHRASKAAQFGLGEIQPDQPFTNRERLTNAVNILLASIPYLPTPKAIQKKIKKVNQYFAYSLKCR